MTSSPIGTLRTISKEMKKIILGAALCALTSLSHADEGMWMLNSIDPKTAAAMQSLGLQLTPDQLYSTEHASLKDCVVDFSDYCSGVVVSPDGLVFTNHHCGYSAIQSLSTPEDDILTNGFVARSRKKERPAEGLFVKFLQRTEDCTDRIMQALNKVYEEHPDEPVAELNKQYTDSIMAAAEKEFQNDNPGLDCMVKAYYSSNAFYVSFYKVYRDIRLVFTATETMGKFGGDTDNWMWPRQTCDFSVFRVYVDPKTGGPAKYSKDNVPMKPKKWAQVSLQGYVPGSFSMTVGYPGSTSRYLSSYGIQERRNAMNEPMYQTREVKQNIMIRHMRADEAVRIKYDSKYASSSNYWKNSIGMNKCIDSIGLIRQKAAYEQKIRQWQDSTGYLKGELDFAKLEQLYQKRFQARRALTFYNETFGRRNTDEMTRRALRVQNGAIINGKEGKPKSYYIEFKNNTDEWDYDTDREILAALLKHYREKVEIKYQPDFFNVIDHDYGGDYQKFVDRIYKKSKLMTHDKKIYVNKKSYHRDPGVIYGETLISVQADIRADLEATYDSIDVLERYLCAAKLRMEEDMPNYSDANFTMRLSYGQVGEYLLDGKPSGYYTEASSIVEKMNRGEQGVIDYEAEPIMKELLSVSDFGKYADKTTGKLHLCFLSNNDITGGNSGSPMFNGKGELIGLAFDGNWDSLSSDIFFDSQLARCIGVDIRYVLYMMEKWGKADRLLQEINAK